MTVLYEVSIRTASPSVVNHIVVLPMPGYPSIASTDGFVAAEARRSATARNSTGWGATGVDIRPIRWVSNRAVYLSDRNS
jgi:hypothetical protein